MNGLESAQECAQLRATENEFELDADAQNHLLSKRKKEYAFTSESPKPTTSRVQWRFRGCLENKTIHRVRSVTHFVRSQTVVENHISILRPTRDQFRRGASPGNEIHKY